MIFSKIPLVDWGNGVIMIGLFALVVVLLVGFLIYFMNSGNKKKGITVTKCKLNLFFQVKSGPS